MARPGIRGLRVKHVAGSGDVLLDYEVSRELFDLILPTAKQLFPNLPDHDAVAETVKWTIMNHEMLRRVMDAMADAVIARLQRSR